MIMMYHYMIRVILKQSLKQKGWNHAHLFVIDRLRACVLVDIYSWVCVRDDIDRWEDRAHGFGIDWLRACVRVDIFSFACFRVDIDSWEDITHWFVYDRLRACVCVDIDSWQDHAHRFVINRLRACVLVDIYSWVCVRDDIEDEKIVPMGLALID